mmetsp:Transcript_43912/g.106485  ORF Transcript_43912/g.106485 Transcript_43912/m.106485 type:complete len:128 (+) Transcript_43912:917-1300(+)
MFLRPSSNHTYDKQHSKHSASSPSFIHPFIDCHEIPIVSLIHEKGSIKSNLYVFNSSVNPVSNHTPFLSRNPSQFIQSIRTTSFLHHHSPSFIIHHPSVILIHHSSLRYYNCTTAVPFIPIIINIIL